MTRRIDRAPQYFEEGDDVTLVARLEHLLRDRETRHEAFEIIRGLIESVELRPVDDHLEVELRGDLAGILGFAGGAKGRHSQETKSMQIKLVAGAGFEPATFRL